MGGEESYSSTLKRNIILTACPDSQLVCLHAHNTYMFHHKRGY